MDAQTFRRDFRKFCEDNLRGDITADELYQAILGNGLGMVAEKVIGPAGAAINATYFEEAERYLIGARSLDETVRIIKTKADELIRAQQ